MRKPAVTTWTSKRKGVFKVQIESFDGTLVKLSFSTEDVLEMILNRHPMAYDMDACTLEKNVCIDREMLGDTMTGTIGEKNLVILDGVRITFPTPDKYMSFLDSCLEFLGLEHPDTWE